MILNYFKLKSKYIISKLLFNFFQKISSCLVIHLILSFFICNFIQLSLHFLDAFITYNYPACFFELRFMNFMVFFRWIFLCLCGLKRLNFRPISIGFFVITQSVSNIILKVVGLLLIANVIIEFDVRQI